MSHSYAAILESIVEADGRSVVIDPEQVAGPSLTAKRMTLDCAARYKGIAISTSIRGGLTARLSAPKPQPPSVAAAVAWEQSEPLPNFLDLKQPK